jgi:hypothetical protein
MLLLWWALYVLILVNGSEFKFPLPHSNNRVCVTLLEILLAFQAFLSSVNLLP